LFQEKFGFNIDQAIHIYKSIMNECENRINEKRLIFRRKAKRDTDEQIMKNPILESSREELELSNFGRMLFGDADVHLSFTFDEIVELSSLSTDICSAFLNRLSQQFGYRNSSYPTTFTDPLKAPWDFNTLYERPIVSFSSKFFIPNPALFPGVLINTFHYDLMSDQRYKSDYERIRGKWLEQRTAAALSPIFGSENIILNPKFPNGEELADVLVLCDRKIFIIQCKSKGLRYESKIGEDYYALIDDIIKGIKESFGQALRARKYLLDSENPIVLAHNEKLTIDTKQVTDVFLISITLGYYQSIVTRLANFKILQNLFTENDYPWAISLADFEVVTEIISDPFEFIHYAKQRTRIGQVSLEVSADEIDLLNYYLSQGLNLESGAFQDYTNIILVGFSSEVDKYFHDKYVLAKQVIKPRRDMSEGFREYLDAIGSLHIAYKSNCIDKLLLLNKASQKVFVDKVTEMRKGQLKADRIKAMNMLFSKYDFGITFLLVDSEMDINYLYQQLISYSILRKYKQKLTTWVSLGVDINSPKQIDLASYISYPWIKDREIEKMLKHSKLHNNMR
jgi:hypothetical protein